MYFFSKNLGDNLNNFLLRKMIDRKISFYNIPKKKHIKLGCDPKVDKYNKVSKIDLIFIGSILEVLTKNPKAFQIKKKEIIASKWYFKLYDYIHPLLIYGAGFISKKNKKESYIRNIKLLAVRGNITLHRFIKNNIKVTNSIVLADPGILFPFLFDQDKLNKTIKIYDLCIIPHYVDLNNKLIKVNIKVHNIFILNIKETPDKFFDTLLKCKRVLSSSLHGLIFSDSLRIPNMRMVVSDKVIGGDYKFKDYYSAYGLELPMKIDLRKTVFEENQLNTIDENYKISDAIIKKKQCQLLISFPYKLKKEFQYFKNLCRKKNFLFL